MKQIYDTFLFLIKNQNTTFQRCKNSNYNKTTTVASQHLKVREGYQSNQKLWNKILNTNDCVKRTEVTTPRNEQPNTEGFVKNSLWLTYHE